MATEIRCPHCGQTYGLSDEQVPQYSGQTIHCTKCSKPFTVPILTSPAIPQGEPVMQQDMPAAQAVGYATPAGFHQRPNGMATASLVFGILAFCIPLVSSVLAIVFGIIGLKRTRDPNVGGKGLAISGIVLGSVSLIMVPCMISILLPSLNRARETANRVKCAANMKSLGMAMLLYSSGNQGKLPPGLPELILDQQLSGDLFVCPSSSLSPATNATPMQLAQMIQSGTVNSYVYAGSGSLNNLPANAILLYEPISDHGNDGANFLFADGHVEFYTRNMAERTIARLKAGNNPP